MGGILVAWWFLGVGLGGPCGQGAGELLQVKWRMWRFRLMRIDG